MVFKSLQKKKDTDKKHTFNCYAKRAPGEFLAHSNTGVLLQFRMANGYLYDVGTNSQQWLSVNNALFNKNKKRFPLPSTQDPDSETLKSPPIPPMLSYRDAW